MSALVDEVCRQSLPTKGFIWGKVASALSWPEASEAFQPSDACLPHP